MPTQDRIGDTISMNLQQDCLSEGSPARIPAVNVAGQTLLINNFRPFGVERFTARLVETLVSVGPEVIALRL